MGAGCCSGFSRTADSLTPVEANTRLVDYHNCEKIINLGLFKVATANLYSTRITSLDILLGRSKHMHAYI